tara:strand:- start:5991 stop:7124 length:1134 start_codon:yes stop_codon:yes gene_type:complete
MYKITKEDMQLIVNGASFLASGGGGGVASANDVITNIINFSDEVTVVEKSEIKDADELLVICGVGAPDAPNLNFKDSPANGLIGLQDMTGKTYTHVLPIEVGAMNSMIPLLACAKLNIPFVDGDGAGRSVPQMDMCTYALKKIPTLQTLVVSEQDKQFPIHPKNAAEMEASVRKIVSDELHDAGTVATWTMSGETLKQKDGFVEGSFSLAKRIGQAMALSSPLDGVQGIIQGYYPDNRIIMRNTEVIHATTKVEDGFDVGTVTLRDTDNKGITATLYFVNESLLATLDRDSEPFCFMMGPDMICSMGVDGSPMTNSEICSQFNAGKKVNISLMWVQAVDAIRTPSMFLLYAKLISEKFGNVYSSQYSFVDEVSHELF